MELYYLRCNKVLLCVGFRVLQPNMRGIDVVTVAFRYIQLDPIVDKYFNIRVAIPLYDVLAGGASPLS